MEKLKILTKLSYKFTKKYLKEYFKMLLKPLTAALMGVVFFLFLPVNSLITLLSIPCFCYAFWKGYFITYCLNYAAYDFIKENESLAFKEVCSKASKIEKNFALYISFCALITIILYLPGIYYLYNLISKSNIFGDYLALIGIIGKSSVVILINSILPLPFFNFLTQAYFFKKEKENFLQLFLNCYTKLDKTGVLLSIIIGIIGIALNCNTLLYLILLIFINPFIYAINTFWYSTRVK